MSRLPRISGRDAIKALGKHGFVQERIRGSHAILKKEGFALVLSVPLHRELDTGLLRDLIKSAELTVEEFIELL